MLTKQISSENVELNRNHKNSCRVQEPGDGKNANKTKKMKTREPENRSSICKRKQKGC